LKGFPETWAGAPDVTISTNAYHEGKRAAELMGNVFSSISSVEFISARLFAFLAPFLPLNEHFAAGNFIRDASERKQICIESGGGSVRSYQYATDLCVSLWALLVRGEDGQAFNVGSEEPVSILELAQAIGNTAKLNEKVSVLGVDTEQNVTRYIPSTKKIRVGLLIREDVHLIEAIQRTLSWVQLARD